MVVACMNLNQAAREAYWGAYPNAPLLNSMALVKKASNDEIEVNLK